MADRGVSSVLGYALSLAIVTILITGIFAGMGGTVQNEREKVIRSELTVLGNRIAADIGAADRLASVKNGSVTVRITTTLPTTVAGKAYTIQITDTGSNTTSIKLSTVDPAVSDTITVRTEKTVSGTTFRGADIIIVADGSTVEVSNV